MRKVIVTEKPESWHFEQEGLEIIKPSSYIKNAEYSNQKNIKVINLCKSYHYQSEGYYISLLAEARGHKVIPVISTLMDFKLPNLAREDAEDFDKLIQEILNKTQSESKVTFTICFGKTENPELQRIGTLLFNLFQAPIHEVVFLKKDKWTLQTLKPLNLKELKESDRNLLYSALDIFLSGRRITNKNYTRRKYDLAILVKPGDDHPPSDARALQKFVKAAETIGFNAEFITKADYSKLSDYDALFIRETTNVNHHSFRFARKAEYEGLAVIDDPSSILKCTNKVYLDELLRSHKVPTPKSMILHKQNYESIKEMPYPFVIKLPDGAFSKGVKKVENDQDLEKYLKEYFQQSELVIAQEFMPTDFDWRIGVLDGKILYVCKYFMARNHWQIIDWRSTGKHREGVGETINVKDAPKALLDVALKASNLIGNGLYGVDIKELNSKYYIIEINDNPNIDSGLEDKIGNMEIYETIMKSLMDRVLNGLK